jgi:hypothetical protein
MLPLGSACTIESNVELRLPNDEERGLDSLPADNFAAATNGAATRCTCFRRITASS